MASPSQPVVLKQTGAISVKILIINLRTKQNCDNGTIAIL